MLFFHITPLIGNREATGARKNQIFSTREEGEKRKHGKKKKIKVLKSRVQCLLSGSPDDGERSGRAD